MVIDKEDDAAGPLIKVCWIDKRRETPWLVEANNSSELNKQKLRCRPWYYFQLEKRAQGLENLELELKLRQFLSDICLEIACIYFSL